MVKGKQKTYVLDTNVIMSDPDCFFQFEDNHVVIPSAVLEELDNHKKDRGDVGYNVKKAGRTLDKLSESGEMPIKLNNIGGNLDFSSEEDFSAFPTGWDKTKNDNRILAVTKNIPGAILITNDRYMRIKARNIGIEAQEYKHEAVEEDFLLYEGRTEGYVQNDMFMDFASGSDISIESIKSLDNRPFIENEFVVLHNEADSDAQLLGIVKNGFLTHLKYHLSAPFGIHPRNLGQHFAIEALMSPAEEVPLVILSGVAGTSKTFLTLACALEQVMNQKIYRKLTVTRSNVEFDKDIGALPGTEEDKVGPLLRGCMDNLEQLLCGCDFGDRTENEIQSNVWYTLEKGWIKAEALGFLRGRSLNSQILFVDEAQNTTPSQMNGILTRAGEYGKIVIAGDLDQIDNPRLDRHNNGLAHAIKLMMGEQDCCIVKFTNEEATRSKLAAKVAEKIAAGK